MRLEKIQTFLKERGFAYSYAEENGCADINFMRKEFKMHIWEYPPEEPGAQSNVRWVNRMEDYDGEDYEDQILAVMREWE